MLHLKHIFQFDDEGLQPDCGWCQSLIALHSQEVQSRRTLRFDQLPTGKRVRKAKRFAKQTNFSGQRL